MIEVHLYGKLRRHAADSKANEESVLRLEARSDETVRTLLGRAGIDQSEVFHLFLNGSILRTENSMAPWLKYRQIEGRGLDTPLSNGDRLGLFARDMALLVV
jgi:molybdopterin converting factor small subunit